VAAGHSASVAREVEAGAAVVNMRLDRCLALFGWRPGVSCAGSEFLTRLDRLRVTRGSIWLLRRGGGPEGMVLVWHLGDLCGERVCRPGWFAFGQCGGRSSWLEVCSLHWWSRCVDDVPHCLCGFFVLVFLINCALYSLYGFWIRFSYNLSHSFYLIEQRISTALS
jgi:hypothetical protein